MICSSSGKKIDRRVAWSPALQQRSTRNSCNLTPPTGGDHLKSTLLSQDQGCNNSETDQHDLDSATDLTNEKLKAMRKSLRSRSVCSSTSAQGLFLALFVCLLAFIKIPT